MNSDGRETAIELVERIKRAADKLQDKGNSIHENLLEICKLARQLKKNLICVAEKLGGKQSERANAATATGCGKDVQYWQK